MSHPLTKGRLETRVESTEKKFLGHSQMKSPRDCRARYGFYQRELQSRSPRRRPHGRREKHQTYTPALLRRTRSRGMPYLDFPQVICLAERMAICVVNAVLCRRSAP